MGVIVFSFEIENLRHFFNCQSVGIYHKLSEKNQIKYIWRINEDT